ncbi:uncharacterized protein LOC107041685 isoform X2 [Diachasma alloeum]|uniref:uncharacterized protein LOC107041685 isoform X2 n=1 Tax=Diachasma alloeum TaxID=454923 RepID=UPI0007382A60|nr:uncharacterized protein LOC107041685 isoform X2 [Diachasma alloeum]
MNKVKVQHDDTNAFCIEIAQDGEIVPYVALRTTLFANSMNLRCHITGKGDNELREYDFPGHICPAEYNCKFSSGFTNNIYSEATIIESVNDKSAEHKLVSTTGSRETGVIIDVTLDQLIKLLHVKLSTCFLEVL